MRLHINEILNSIIRTDAYLDTVVLFSRRSPIREFPKIKAAGCGSVHGPELCRDRNNNVCGFLTSVHQPSEECLYVLDQLLGEYRASFSGFDVAYDVFTRQPNEVMRWFEESIVMRWRRPGFMHGVASTKYWTCYQTKPMWRQDFVAYSDKPSKLYGLPAPHFEIRQRTAQAVRKFGFKKPSDLISLDPFKYFERVAKLVDYNSDQFIQRIVQRSVRAERESFLKSKKKRARRSLFTDRYRASLGFRARALCKRIHLDCAQGLQSSHGEYLKRLKRISTSALKITPSLKFKRPLIEQTKFSPAPCSH